MSNSFWDLPIATIEKALGIRKEIEALQASINSILGGTTTKQSTPTKVDGRKGKRSAASRAKMAASQKARWAKKNAGSTSPVAKAPKKGGMSAAGRARIAAAQKARWAKVKATSAAVKSVVKAAKKKRTMSPEARERIAAAQRARWAKQKAA